MLRICQIPLVSMAHSVSNVNGFDSVTDQLGFARNAIVLTNYVVRSPPRPAVQAATTPRSLKSGGELCPTSRLFGNFGGSISHIARFFVSAV